MKNLTRIASFALAFFLLIGISTPAAKAAGTVQYGIAFVDASSLRLRSSPSTTAKTIAYAKDKEVVVVTAKSGDWYKVIYNLQEGYMHSSYLDVSTKGNAELGYGKVTGSKVNIRSGPGTSYSSLTRASSGDKAYIIGINNGWYKIIFGDHIGYIRSDYLALTEIPYENAASGKKPLFFVGGKSTGVKPSAAALGGSSTTNVTASRIIATAKKYIGVPYVWGGTTPSGFDCSGFVQYVFKAHGITLPRTAKQQWSVGTSVSKANLKPGDLVYFANTYTSGISHLGIYIGNNQFIHASSSQGVTISSLSNSYWASHYHGAKRVL